MIMRFIGEERDGLKTGGLYDIAIHSIDSGTGSAICVHHGTRVYRYADLYVLERDWQKAYVQDDTADAIAHENVRCIPVSRLLRHLEPYGADDKRGQLLYDIISEALEGLPVYNVCIDTLRSEPLEREDIL